MTVAENEDANEDANGAESDIQGGRRAFRAAILQVTLPHVAFDGWRPKALAAGAVDAGFAEIDAERAFPGGPVEAILLHSELADRAMTEAFLTLDPPPARTREKIAALIRIRLEGATGDREAVRPGLGFLARPHHAGAGLKALARTADAIWRAAGDRSTDFNWYTKRALVSAVYMATVAYWLSDRSDGYADTWSFLDRRIDTALKAPMQIKSLAEKLKMLTPRPSRIASALRRRRTAGNW